MLRHARERLDGVVEGDIETLELAERFDVVLLASHLVNTADIAQRQAFWRCCADHVTVSGTVIVERHDPGWVRAAVRHQGVNGDVSIELHDVDHRGEVLIATVTYSIGDCRWHQQFRAVALDDEEFFDEARAVGLVFADWLDSGREWARFSAPASPGT